MMTHSRRAAILMGVGGLPLLAMGGAAGAKAAGAEAVVKVALWDKGEASMEGMEGMAPLGLAMPGADMAMATMGITLDVAQVTAGEIKLQIANESQSFYHNVTISALADPTQALPYLAEAAMVDAEALGVVARSRDLGLRERETVTLTLTPGNYILYCNIAGHYMMGMWALLTVTP